MLSILGRAQLGAFEPAAVTATGAHFTGEWEVGASFGGAWTGSGGHPVAAFNAVPGLMQLGRVELAMTRESVIPITSPNIHGSWRADGVSAFLWSITSIEGSWRADGRFSGQWTGVPHTSWRADFVFSGEWTRSAGSRLGAWECDMRSNNSWDIPDTMRWRMDGRSTAQWFIRAGQQLGCLSPEDPDSGSAADPPNFVF